MSNDLENKPDIQKISNFDLLTRKGILDKIIEDSADDPRIEEPKRQLKIIMAEVDRRGIVKDENGEYNFTVAEVNDNEIDTKNNNQTIKLDTLQLIAKKD